MSEELPETSDKHVSLPRRILAGLLAFAWPIAAFFVASFAAGLLLLAASVLSGKELSVLFEQNHAVRLAYQLATAVAVLVLVALPLYKVFFKPGTPWRQIFGLGRKPNFDDTSLALLMFGAYLLATIAATSIISVLFTDIDLQQAQELGLSDPTTTLQYVLVFITLVVIPPVFEELIFRGFVFSALRQKYSFWLSAVLTSLAFAIIHLQLNVGIDVFILSLFLCYVRERSGALWAPILLHTAKNVLAFLLLFVWGIR